MPIDPDLKQALRAAARVRKLTMTGAARVAIEAFVATTVADINSDAGAHSKPRRQTSIDHEHRASHGTEAPDGG